MLIEGIDNLIVMAVDIPITRIKLVINKLLMEFMVKHNLKQV